MLVWINRLFEDKEWGRWSSCLYISLQDVAKKDFSVPLYKCQVPVYLNVTFTSIYSITP